MKSAKDCSSPSLCSVIRNMWKHEECGGVQVIWSSTRLCRDQTERPTLPLHRSLSTTVGTSETHVTQNWKKQLLFVIRFTSGPLTSRRGTRNAFWEWEQYFSLKDADIWMETGYFSKIGRSYISDRKICIYKFSFNSF